MITIVVLVFIFVKLCDVQPEDIDSMAMAACAIGVLCDILALRTALGR